ncbi:MAG: MXAN_5187 C-terminal domain-containing protein [Polyangia bacterium]
MHRIKIGLIAAIVMAALTGVFYVGTTTALRQASQDGVEARVSRAQRIYSDVSQLDGLKLVNLAALHANQKLPVPPRPNLGSPLAVFDRSAPAERQQAAFEICEAQNEQLRAELHKADIVAILDASGRIIARNLNANADVGLDLRATYPAVAQALAGKAVKDVWTWQSRVYEVALAPINKPDNSVAGALLLGWVVSATTAQAARGLLDAEVGFFHGGKVYASSFVSSTDKSREDVSKTQALSNLLFSGDRIAEQVLQGGAPTGTKIWEIDGHPFAAVVAPMPGNFADKTSGFVVLASLSEGMADVHLAGQKVLGLGLLAIFITVVTAVLTARRFLAPLDQIELGVAEVINGNIDYTFKPVGQDFEGLSNSLNVMLARLLGREEPSDEVVEDEEEGGRKVWKAEAMEIDDSDTAAPAATVAALADEGEAAYYPRLYAEYVAALKALGQPVEGISVLAFMAKLSLSEAGLREKWDCKTVRFLLASQGDRVVFRPVQVA